MKKILLRRALLAAAIGTASSGASAAGFFLNETSTSGLGRAFAAENTIGDNAAILGRNPAGSALFDTITLTGGVTYVNPEIDTAGDVTYFIDTPLFSTEVGPIAARDNDYASSAWIPNGYLAVPIDDCWSFGLALFSNYGLETDFDGDSLMLNMADKTSLLTANVAPSVAYNYRDIFSVGLAANFLYADAELKTRIPNDFPPDELLGQFGAPPLSGARILKLEGDDWDVSWSVGALWNITDRTRVGLSYHADFDPKLEGDVDSDLITGVDGLPLDDTRGNLTLELPDYWELGLYHRFEQNWGLALGVVYTDWDDFERLEAFLPDERFGVEPEPFNPLLIREENFKSGWRYSIAGEYYPCPEVTWRIGYAYDEGAARDGLNPLETDELGLDITWRSLSIPDTDRQWVTFGGTYEFDNHLSLDGGVAYLWGDDEKVQEASVLPSDLGTITAYFDGGTTKTEAWLASVSLNYSF